MMLPDLGMQLCFNCGNCGHVLDGVGSSSVQFSSGLQPTGFIKSAPVTKCPGSLHSPYHLQYPSFTALWVDPGPSGIPGRWKVVSGSESQYHCLLVLGTVHYLGKDVATEIQALHNLKEMLLIIF